MDPQLRSHFTAVLNELELIRDRADVAMDRIRGILETDPAPSTNPDAFKGDNGRLTEAAIRAINTSFDSGATTTEISQQFGIVFSAAAYRRSVWEKQQDTKYLRIHAAMAAGQQLSDDNKTFLRRRGLNDVQILRFVELNQKARGSGLSESEKLEISNLTKIVTSYR